MHLRKVISFLVIVTIFVCSIISVNAATSFNPSLNNNTTDSASTNINTLWGLYRNSEFYNYNSLYYIYRCRVSNIDYYYLTVKNSETSKYHHWRYGGTGNMYSYQGSTDIFQPSVNSYVFLSNDSSLQGSVKSSVVSNFIFQDYQLYLWICLLVLFAFFIFKKRGGSYNV